MVEKLKAPVSVNVMWSRHGEGWHESHWLERTMIAVGYHGRAPFALLDPEVTAFQNTLLMDPVQFRKIYGAEDGWPHTIPDSGVLTSASPPPTPPAPPTTLPGQ